MHSNFGRPSGGDNDSDSFAGAIPSAGAPGAARRRLAKKCIGIACAVAVTAFAGAAHAQAYPSKPIRVISTFPAGLGPDTTMRILAEKLTKQLGQPVVIDSRPGGNGFIATSALKQSAPDGYTLLLLSNAHTSINPYLFKNVPYNVEADFDPISTIYRAPFFIATAANGPYQTLKQLITAAKSAPNKVSYGMAYAGSPTHLGAATFEHLTQSKMLAVPFKDAGQLNTSVANGEVDFTILTLGSINALVKGGKLKILAIAEPNRLKTEPTVPTVEEAGGPKGLTIESWVGLVAPHGTPPEVVRKLNEEIGKALATPDLMERYTVGGVVASGATPAEMTKLIQHDNKVNADLIKLIGMKVE